jgi:hypothetical protein
MAEPIRNLWVLFLATQISMSVDALGLSFLLMGPKSANYIFNLKIGFSNRNVVVYNETWNNQQ